MLNLALITIVWLSLLAVLLGIATLILPVINGVTGALFASVARVAVSLSLFMTWLLWWVVLAYYWFYNVLGGERRIAEEES